MRILFLLFIILPILEMWILIKVGGVIGAWPTIGLVMLTAVVGAGLLRRQGLATLLRAQERLNAGEVPATEILEGLFLAIGGALLLTPGFVTDTVGFACLIGPARRWMIRGILARGMIHVRGQGFPPDRQPPGDPQGREAPGRRGVTIDGDYRRDD